MIWEVTPFTTATHISLSDVYSEIGHFSNKTPSPSLLAVFVKPNANLRRHCFSHCSIKTGNGTSVLP